jgi:hypothetical protein
MAAIYAAYSFVDVMCSITGPGGSFPLGQDAGIGEGGISMEMIEDKITMVIGADGSPMISLHAGQGANLIFRVLKVSPTNQLLSLLYDFQASSSANTGLNTIVISDLARGDVTTCAQCAFRRQPPNLWAKDANTIEWPFVVGRLFQTLGSGNLAA